MGVRKLQEFLTIAKYGLDKSFMVAKFLCFVHVTNTYLCGLGEAEGPSMLPTLSLTGDLILAERISARFGKLGKSFMVAKFLCFVHVTNTYLCGLGEAEGPSMLPTLSLTGDLILAERISARFGKLGPGDIVFVRSPEDPRTILVKRVKGMEGDSVTYIVDPKNSDRRKTVIVPKGCVWIEGDNMYMSTDSREFGAVPYGLVQGKVFWRIWPRERFGSVG